MEYPDDGFAGVIFRHGNSQELAMLSISFWVSGQAVSRG